MIRLKMPHQKLILCLILLQYSSACDGAYLPPHQEPCNGVCVESYLCVNNSVLVYGEGLIDIRLGSNDNPKYCPKAEVCCTLNDYETSEETDYPEVSQVKATKPIHRCGVRYYKPVKNKDSRKHKDSISQFGEFPWMVAVLQSKAESQRMYTKSTPINAYNNVKPTFDYRGGGSLIHPNAVLTAAHCVAAIPHDRLFIRVGEWDTRRNDEPAPHQNQQVKRAVIHPNFNSLTISNDIAILILAQPVRLANHINTICLPPPQHRFSPSSRCFVSGWGKDKYGGRFQALLKRVSVPLVDRVKCQNALRRNGLGPFFKLHHSFLCAGGEQGDSCRGDGGSPLVCPAGRTEPNTDHTWPEEQENENNNGDVDDSEDSFVPAEHIRAFIDDDAVAEAPFYQAGIVSWGIGCNGQVPAAYGKVAMFRTWIDGVMARNGYDTRYYTEP